MRIARSRQKDPEICKNIVKKEALNTIFEILKHQFLEIATGYTNNSNISIHQQPSLTSMGSIISKEILNLQSCIIGNLKNQLMLGGGLNMSSTAFIELDLEMGDVRKMWYCKKFSNAVDLIRVSSYASCASEFVVKIIDEIGGGRVDTDYNSFQGFRGGGRHYSDTRWFSKKKLMAEMHVFCVKFRFSPKMILKISTNYLLNTNYHFSVGYNF